jgi:FAD/FMN-containing dehydrogenase
MHAGRSNDGAVRRLESSFAGELVWHGEGRYEESRALWNAVIETEPLLVARCASADDVAAALGFARESGLGVAVRGGGHGVAGNALVADGVVVDLSPMRRVEVDPASRIARAQAGATLGDLDAATQAHGLAAPLGVVSETGIAGLTLGGGIGWLRRKHGLSCDNLVAAEVVTADGRRVTASETESPDLFWALCGGGSGVGVVTSFEYRVHPVGPQVLACFVLYPGERAAEVLRFCDEYLREAPDDVSPVGVLGHVPAVDLFPAEAHGRPFAALLAVHPGGAEEGARVLAPLRSLGDPIADLSGPMPYVEAQRMLDEDYPDGGRYYWKSVDLDELSDEVLDALAEQAASAPSPHSTIDVWFHGGAMSRVDPAATAFGRRPAYLVGVEANWHDDDQDAANVAWARSAVDAVRPFSSGGGYLNFPGFFEEGAELLRDSHGSANYDRLVTIRSSSTRTASSRRLRRRYVRCEDRRRVDSRGHGHAREEAGMTHYGTLRLWAAFLTILGVLGLISAGVGTIVWAFEVDGFWQTLGVLLIGGPVAIFLATLPIALGQALRAIADVGDTVHAG